MGMDSSHSPSSSSYASATSQPSGGSPAFHKYACVRCRLRKVKCDKLLPKCANCNEARTQCAYSARRPRKNQKVHHDKTAQRPILPVEQYLNDIDRQGSLSCIPGTHDASISSEEDEDVLIPREVRDSTFEAKFDSTQPERGKLFVAHGKSRYINSDKAFQVWELSAAL